MKLSILLAFILTQNVFANTNNLDNCYKSAKKFYNANRGPSDIPIRFEKSHLLKAGESLLNFQKNEIAKFETDKLIYVGSGSYYSGWFTDLIVVNPENCQGESVLNIYSE